MFSRKIALVAVSNWMLRLFLSFIITFAVWDKTRRANAESAVFRCGFHSNRHIGQIRIFSYLMTTIRHSVTYFAMFSTIIYLFTIDSRGKEQGTDTIVNFGAMLVMLQMDDLLKNVGNV